MRAREVCEEVLQEARMTWRSYTEERLARALILALDGLEELRPLSPCPCEDCMSKPAPRTLASIEAIFEEAAHD